MTIKLDTLNEICNLATRQVQDMYPDLEMMFIPHEPGQFQEIVATHEYEISRHPAGRIAQSILEKNSTRDVTSFLGMAIHQELKWLGLASRERLLALFNINTGTLDSPKQARGEIYHLIWHALDLIDVRRRPEYAAKFRAGPMVPKRSPMNLARLNLQADTFSAVMNSLLGDEDSLDSLSRKRAIDAISPIYERRAEDYPFVIAVEAAKYAYEAIKELKPARSKYMHYARQLAIEIGHTFDDASIRNWWGFSEPAQNMAWRHLPRDLILGCAVSTSEDPFVRATGHLVSDIAGIVPVPPGQIGTIYNAYVNLQQNQLLHREMAEKTFAEAVEQGMREESGRALLLAANEQNENLIEGNILGWCANALQAAARAFESALLSGVSPQQAARMQFEGTKDIPDWETLNKIGDTIIGHRRTGMTTTLSTVADLCGGQPALEPVLNSIRATLQDPSYIQKIEATYEIGPRPLAPAPAGPTPATPTPAKPSYSAPAPVSGPSLGGGSNMARQKAYYEKLRQEQQGDMGDDDRKQ